MKDKMLLLITVTAIVGPPCFAGDARDIYTWTTALEGE
jgi:hypothetical protein